MDFIFGAEYPFFVFFQIGSNVSFGVYESLFADVIIRDFTDMRSGNFNVIAEDFVVAYLEVGDTGFFAFLFLAADNPVFSAEGYFSEFVQSFVVVFAEDAAFVDAERGIIDDRSLQTVAEFLHRIQILREFRQESVFRFFQFRFDFRDLFERFAESKSVAGIASAGGEAGECPLDVAQRFQPVFDVPARLPRFIEAFDIFQALFNRFRIGERSAQVFTQEPTSHRC